MCCKLFAEFGLKIGSTTQRIELPYRIFATPLTYIFNGIKITKSTVFNLN